MFSMNSLKKELNITISAIPESFTDAPWCTSVDDLNQYLGVYVIYDETTENKETHFYFLLRGAFTVKVLMTQILHFAMI